MSPVLETKSLLKRFGGLLATDQLSLAVMPGEVHAVIGPNGAGKTTLINQLTGELKPDGGRIFFAGHDITFHHVAQRARLGLGRSYQISQVFRDLSVLQNMLIAAQARMQHCYRFWAPAANRKDLVEAAARSLALVGLGDKAASAVSTLAHGEVRQLELAMALVSDPKLLLLDEPMAGMGPAESDRIIQLLRSLKGRYSVLLVEHDMDAVFALADRVSVLVNGKAIASGSIEQVRADAAVREAYLGEEYAA